MLECRGHEERDLRRGRGLGDKAQLGDALLPTRPAFVPGGRPWTYPEHLICTLTPPLLM